MKNNKIQIVRTSGLIGILALGGLTGVMIFCPWGLDSKETELVRARQKAEVIAYQIVAIYKEAKSDTPAENAPIQRRGLASVQNKIDAGGILKEFKNQGSMGMDPWGHPYQYRIVPHGADSKLVVWSLGPNGNLDTQVLMSDSNEVLTTPLLGDDIRVQLPLPEAGSL